MKTIKQQIGAWGEEVAARFLLQKKYEIVARNFKTRMGEIDIIAWHDKTHHGKTLCFVEVKTRGSSVESGARATSRYEKVLAMQHAAMAFCMRNRINVNSTPIQFEYMSIQGRPGERSARVRHAVIEVC